MKKILVSLIIGTSLFSGVANADGYHHGYRGGYGWMAPLIIGGAVGYTIAQPRTVVVQQPQVVYLPQPAAPPVPYGYHYENILDANCNCYRSVLVPN